MVVRRCKRETCWVWRYHKFNPIKTPIDIRATSKDYMTASWLILTKKQLSLYDPYIEAYSDLSWFPICYAPTQCVDKYAFTFKYRACTGEISEKLLENPSTFRINRGDIVGVSQLADHKCIIQKHVALGVTPD